MKTASVRFVASVLCLIGSLMLSPPQSLAQTFSATGSMTTGRHDHTATLLQNGMVLIAGGELGYYSTLSSAELYNPSTGTFTATGRMTNARRGHTATLLQNGKVLITGGYYNSYIFVSSAELYDPSTGTFSATGALNTVRYDQTATLLQNGVVLIAGGYNSSTYVLSSAELYNPSTGTFTATGSMTMTRRLHTATLLDSGIVLITGGYNWGKGTVSSAELYNSSTGTFSATASMASARYSHTATLLNNRMVLVAGGWSDNSNSSTSHAELYNPSTGTFAGTGDMTTKRTAHTATLLENGTVLVAGGDYWNGSTNVLSSAELYNASTGTFAATGSMTKPRILPTAVLLNNGRVLIAGGRFNTTAQGDLSSAEVYDSGFVMGFINPKYVIVGVTYAPPGASSNVTYTGSIFVGNTTATTGSFTIDNNLTISAKHTISAWTIVGGAAVELTGTESTDYVEGSNSSSTVTISKQSSVSDKTNGTGNAFSPVNHDYDTIWLWLNPLMIYGVKPNDPTFLQWNGYGYDNNDVNGPDIFGVQVGWLNGHFGVNPSIQTVLARGWVTANEPGMIWPTGEGPGLTSADITNILKADPFTSGTYSLPTPLPSTSADGRFTQIPYPPNPVNYTQAGLGNGGGTTTGYNVVYTDTSNVGKGSSYTFKQAFGTEQNFSGGTWFAKFTLDLKETDTLTWTHTWQNTLTTTTTLTDALSVTGPGCPQTSPPCVPAYAGPGEFLVYQDNLYGTFMFYPGN